VDGELDVIAAKDVVNQFSNVDIRDIHCKHIPKSVFSKEERRCEKKKTEKEKRREDLGENREGMRGDV
jgi:proteasome assembly chaperone (PAC2) family protein